MLSYRALFVGIALAPLVTAGCHRPEDEKGPGPVGTTQVAATKGSEALWLILKEKADLAPALAMRDWKKRGQFVYDQLTSTANRSQASLRSRLSAQGVKFHPFWLVNTIRVEGSWAAISALAKDPAVEKVIPDQIVHIPPIRKGKAQPHLLATEWGLNNINVPNAWNTFGARGEGIVVANIDTGVQFDHPALVRQYRGNMGNGTFDHNYNWFDPSHICGNPSNAPCDNAGHGSHTMGTMVGDDGDPGTNQIGVAPHARWIAAKGCEDFGCSFEALLASGQWVLAPTDLTGANPRPDLRPHVVNNSWGGGPGQDFYRATVQAWVAAGIFPAFANGNAGPSCGSAGSPGDYPESYGVGAYDINNVIAGFSSRGASAFGVGKPNISAPGVDVRSSVPGNAYDVFSGTSMATPHLSGVVALIWSAAPSLVGDIAATRTLLDQTARDTSDLSCGGTPENNNVFGEGRVDAFAAVDLSPRGPTGTLESHVGTPEGEPVVGANVHLEGPTTRNVLTNSAGNLTSILPVGTYAATVTAFGRLPQMAGLTITEGATTVQNFVLDAAPSFPVSGTVRNFDGTAIAGATVTITGTPIPPAVSGADGTYTFASVPTGTYNVLAQADGRCRSPQTLSLTVDGAETLDFTLPRRQDAFGYFCETPPIAYIEANTVLPLTGDDQTMPVPLPFAFRLYGSTFTVANVSTNGFIDFVEPDAQFSNRSIPDTFQPNGTVYGFWDDLFVDSSGSIRTELVGTAPNRKFVIEWNNVTFFGGGPRITYEIVLQENNEILLQYRMAGPDARQRGASATVGIENAAGTAAFQYSFNEAALDNDTAIRIARQRPNDPNPPTATLTAPTSGSTVGGFSVNVAADASDDMAVAAVDFVLDRGTPNERVIGSVGAPPYQFFWNSTGTPNGPHTMTAVAVDFADNIGASEAVSFNVFFDQEPPMVHITAPASGTTLSGMATLTAEATDNAAVTQVDFLANGLVIGSDTTAPYSITWNTSSFPNGSYQLTAFAHDSQGNIGQSPSVRVSVNNPDAASFDATLHAPKCAATGPACDSLALVNGRGTLGPEPNQPNTLAGSACPDGTGGVYHADESLDRLRIETEDGSPLASGHFVRVTATVWAFGPGDSLDIYHAPNANSPTWSLMGSVQPFFQGEQALSISFMLPPGTALQAIRANFRYTETGDAPSPCTMGGFDDRDDLAFAAVVPDAMPPTATITAPANGTLVHGTVNVTATATDNVGVVDVQLLVDGAPVQTDTTAPYAFAWDSTTVSSGPHQLVARARDAAGNLGSSPAVSVTVDNTAPTVTITSPADGSTVTGTVNVQATATDANSAVTQVQFFLDGMLQFTDTTAPYSWSWNTATASTGMHTLTARARDTATNEGTSPAVTVTVQPPPFQYVWREAESGTPTSPLQNLADPLASGGRYITVAAGNNSQTAPPTNGRMTFTFSVPAAGMYKVWGRVQAPTNGDDSFWVIMDGGTPINWNNIPLGAPWHWDDVHANATPGTPIQFNLSAGMHTLVITYREDGTKLDKILITNDAMFTPTGLGGPPP